MGSPEGGGQAGPSPSDPGHTPSNRVPTLRACWTGDRPEATCLRHPRARLTGAQRLELRAALPHLPGLEVDERLSVLLDGKPVEPLEVVTDHGNRVHVLDGADGRLSVSYTATAVGRAEPVELTEADRVTYARPSRYAESDRLLGFAHRQFDTQVSREALALDVSSWVGRGCPTCRAAAGRPTGRPTP